MGGTSRLLGGGQGTMAPQLLSGLGSSNVLVANCSTYVLFCLMAYSVLHVCVIKWFVYLWRGGEAAFASLGIGPGSSLTPPPTPQIHSVLET